MFQPIPLYVWIPLHSTWTILAGGALDLLQTTIQYAAGAIEALPHLVVHKYVMFLYCRAARWNGSEFSMSGEAFTHQEQYSSLFLPKEKSKSGQRKTRNHHRFTLSQRIQSYVDDVSRPVSPLLNSVSVPLTVTCSIQYQLGFVYFHSHILVLLDRHRSHLRVSPLPSSAPKIQTDYIDQCHPSVVIRARLVGPCPVSLQSLSQAVTLHHGSEADRHSESFSHRLLASQQCDRQQTASGWQDDTTVDNWRLWQR